MDFDVQTCFDDLVARVRAARRKMLGLAWLESLAMVLAGILLAAALLLFLDLRFRLSVAGRIALLAVAGAGLTALLVWRIAVPVARARRFSIHRLGVWMEERFPALESMIVTVLDLHPQLGQPATETRQGLLPLALKSAHRGTVGVDFRQAISSRRALCLSGAALVLLAGAVLFAVFHGDVLRAGILRFTGLRREMRQARAHVSLKANVLETDTVHILDGSDGADAAVISGSGVEIQVIGKTSFPAPLVLLTRAEGETSFASREFAVSATNFIAIPSVTNNTEFFFRLASATTGLFRVRATSYPRIQNVQLRLRLPDYTAVKPQFLPSTDGNIQALFRSDAEVTIQADKPLQRATATIYGQPMAGKVHGSRMTFHFLVTADGSYTVDLVDKDGFRCRQKYERTIKALQDQPPTVEVTTPDELTLTADQVGGVAVALSAQDDYGIEKIRLVYQVGCLPGVTPSKARSKEARRQEKKITPRRMVNMAFPCRFDELGLEVGETVDFHIEVEDTDTESGPHVAKSKGMRLVVVGREMRDWVQIEDEDRWPTDFVGLEGVKRATGLGRPGAAGLVTDVGEKPKDSSPLVSNAAEGAVPHALREVFAEYSDALNN
ncbi:MAG: hypothetical protein GX548_05575 [Lentisphaerae bacterium]|nr:hypothetical protein [Lentisphaerota bacterium]